MKTYTLTLHRLKFFGRHGVYAHETASGQGFEVTAQLVLPILEGEQKDDMASNVDYCQVQEAIRAIVEGDPRRLIETLADELADSLLGQFRAIREVEIEVFKPRPPVTFEFDGVSARVRRARAETRAT